ncbi:MAG: (d)CMP kinase [Deltaproteobacteria bacterium]|nr:MAG: (d)CMP kinase [Deltaproteobacteria bacterium]
MKKLIVAIDGPAGAGKSTVAKRLAHELGYTYMDTGAMYRAFAWKVMQDEIDLEDETSLRKILSETKIDLKKDNGQLRVFLDEVDITDRIRTPVLSQMASKVSTLRAVRERMVELQRAMGREGGVVVEGRDIGTIVFPKAEVKIYLDASSQERARRRFEELKAQGKGINLKETLKEMEERDRRDQEREVAPLRKAKDAVVIDSTQLDAEGVMERIMREVRNKLSPD